jgi:peptidoglycan/LPS O-acetylase OafA/YrhL
MQVKEKHIANLDLFRAIAILFVIFFHVTQMFAGNRFSPLWYTWGKFGVEFFFVLSGFLIGGLFYKQTGRVNLFRFWLLRIFRTYPPYIVALLLSYITVWYTRNQQFDVGYFIFIQNYYHKIPYFLVSWSLCIEEHFYAAFPLFVIISEKWIRWPKGQLVFWVLLSLLPGVFRYFLGSTQHETFGYYETASIFRFDGIAMGCLLSFLVYRMRITINFSPAARIAAYVFFLSVLVLNVWFREDFFMYCFGYQLFNIALLLLIAVFYFSPEFRLARLPFVYPVASMAYSLYLTHAMVINAMDIVAAKLRLGFAGGYIATLIVVFTTGYIFYRLIEKPAIRFRNYYFKNHHHLILSKISKMGVERLRKA